MGIFLGSYHNLSRPKRSDIECVILEGSSLFSSVGKITMSVGTNWWSLARAARDFFKDFDVLAAENPIFSLASQGWRSETEGLGLRAISYFLRKAEVWGS